MSKTRLLTILGLLLATALSRLVPHPANWTAFGALAIWSSFLFRDRWVAVAAPLAVLLGTDLLLGSHVTMPWTFGAFALISFLGSYLQPQKGPGRWVVGSLSASVIFFLLSNFGVWFSAGFYARTWAGLSECFAMAVPFFTAQVSGDLLYCAIFAAVIHMAKIIEPVPRTQTIKVS